MLRIYADTVLTLHHTPTYGPTRQDSNLRLADYEAALYP
jgi:hypothetical protein